MTGVLAFEHYVGQLHYDNSQCVDSYLYEFRCALLHVCVRIIGFVRVCPVGVYLHMCTSGLKKNGR